MSIQSPRVLRTLPRHFRDTYKEVQSRLQWENAEDYKRIHGVYPQGYSEVNAARLQAVAEEIVKVTTGSNAKFKARDAESIFDAPDGTLNPVPLAHALTAKSTPVVIDGQGNAFGGEPDTLYSGKIDLDAALGAPQSTLSHQGLDINSPIHMTVATGKAQEGISPKQLKEALAIAESMQANDAIGYASALRERDVPLEYAYEYFDKLVVPKEGGGTRKLLDTLAQAGNSGRDVYLMGGDKRSSELSPAEKKPLLAKRKASLAKQYIDTGGRSANDPTPGMRRPGTDLEMDHAKEYAGSKDVDPESDYYADDPKNHTWAARPYNGETKNDRSLSDTYALIRAGADLKSSGIPPAQPTKKKGAELLKQLYVDSMQLSLFGRKLTPKMVLDQNAGHLLNDAAMKVEQLELDL